MLWMVMNAVVEVQPAAICSKISAASSRLRPMPPWSSSQYSEQKPSSPARRMVSLGKMPCWSHSAANGASSLSANWRAVSRNASCSSVKLKSMAISG